MWIQIAQSPRFAHSHVKNRDLTGDYTTDARWERTDLVAGSPVAAPTVLFAKLDPSVVDEELRRMEGE